MTSLEKGIYFIEKNDEGKDYYTQAGGCACNHPSMTGYLRTWITNNDFSQDVFNPKWWATLCHWYSEGVFHNTLLEEVKYKDKTIKEWNKVGFDKPSEIEAEIICNIGNLAKESIINHPSFITFTELNKKVEKALNHIKPDDVDKVLLMYGFGTRECYEAWVPVMVYYKDGRQVEGAVTWLNSD